METISNLIGKIGWKSVLFITLFTRIPFIVFFTFKQNLYEADLQSDVDYKVFTDASLYQSPYDRHTYRYTPLLSYIMAPNYIIHQCFGKMLFSLIDIVATYLVYKILNKKNTPQDKRKGYFFSFIYGFNPIIAYLTDRGSCESIQTTLMFAFWYFYFGSDVSGSMSAQQRADKKLTDHQPNKLKKYISYMIFGFWVHVRIYPVIFVPLLIMYQYHSVTQNKIKHALKFTIQFGLWSGGVFFSLLAYFYYLYGYQFLFQTYLYHFSRRDNRHSYSPYFYQIYLNYQKDMTDPSFIRNIARSFPSLYAIYTICFKNSRRYPLFALFFFLTFYFTILNKVVTLQYYQWILSGLYLFIPYTEIYKKAQIARFFGLFIQLISGPLIWYWFEMKVLYSDEHHNLMKLWLIDFYIVLSQIWVITRFIKIASPYQFSEQQKKLIQKAKKVLLGDKKQN